MNNCLTYAIKKWRREGGYLLVRRSLAYEIFDASSFSFWSLRRVVFLVPHFLHQSYDGRITQFVPTEKQIDKDKGSVIRFLVSLWSFDGHIIEGDDHAVMLRLGAIKRAKKQC